METNNKVKHQTSKTILLHFHVHPSSCKFALIAGVAFTDVVTTGETHKIDTTTSVIANVETTADLVETKGIEAISSAESSTGAPELASSENVRETASATTSESQAPTGNNNRWKTCSFNKRQCN